MEHRLSGIPQGRILSLDVLRGFDMFWIIGGASLFSNFFRLFNTPFTDSLVRQFEHTEWNGFTFYDQIFPMFLFIVGTSMAIALGRRKQKGLSKKELYKYVIKRFLLLLFLGFVFNGLFDFNFSNFRYAGVLQRIAFSYLFASIIFIHTSKKVQYGIAAFILLAYWAMMMLIPVPGFGAGQLTPEANLAGYVDRLMLPGRFCCYTFGDNEGILTTLPAIVNTLMGVFAGYWMLSEASQTKKALGLVAAGVASLLVGGLWGLVFPINKLLWTSTYVLWTVGWSLLLLALFYWIVDIKGWQRWAYPFIVIGLNPITIYVAQRLFKFGDVAQVFIHGFVEYLGDFKVVFTILCVLAVKILFLHFLHKHKIYLRA